MASPKAANTPATAIATSAAATAYSESSRPFSSAMNFLIMSCSPIIRNLDHTWPHPCFTGLFSSAYMCTQLIDFVANRCAQSCKSADNRNGHQSCCDCIFRKLQARLVEDKALNHGFGEPARPKWMTQGAI